MDIPTLANKPSKSADGEPSSNVGLGKLWRDEGYLWSRQINLSGLWVSYPSKLFEWCQMRKCLGRVLVAAFLVHAKRNFEDGLATLDATENYRAGADELNYDGEDNIFSIVGGELAGSDIVVFPSHEIHLADEEPSFAKFGDWVMFGPRGEHEELKAASDFSKQNGELETSFWELALEGVIEVSGRYPDAVSERTILTPDIFLTDGSLVPGESKLLIGASTVWGVMIRISPSLSIAGMAETENRTYPLNPGPRPQISDDSLVQWLQSFKDAEGQKATREQAVKALRPRYTVMSIMEAYARVQDPDLKRGIGEKR